jgi:hypothetical protein
MPQADPDHVAVDPRALGEERQPIPAELGEMAGQEVAFRTSGQSLLHSEVSSARVQGKSRHPQDGSAAGEERQGEAGARTVQPHGECCKWVEGSDRRILYAEGVLSHSEVGYRNKVGMPRK